MEAIARRVVELLHDEPSRPSTRLVDATELAAVLGVSRDAIYAHAAELGAVRVGAGKRPRLRFDVERALQAWTAGSVNL